MHAKDAKNKFYNFLDIPFAEKFFFKRYQKLQPNKMVLKNAKIKVAIPQIKSF